MEDVVHYAVALRARQELRTESDQSACGDKELHTDIAGQLRHIRQLRLACAECLHDRAHVLLRHLYGQILHRLAFLPIDRLINDLRFADLQFIALAAHLLDQDGEMQLTASRHFEHICRIRLLNVHRNIRLDLLKETVANMT